MAQAQVPTEVPALSNALSFRNKADFLTRLLAVVSHLMATDTDPSPDLDPGSDPGTVAAANPDPGADLVPGSDRGPHPGPHSDSDTDGGAHAISHGNVLRLLAPPAVRCS